MSCRSVKMFTAVSAAIGAVQREAEIEAGIEAWTGNREIEACGGIL